MHLRVLACDLDGTLAENGEVAAETWQSLRRARDAGLALMLVTGRTLDTFDARGPFAELFEAIVAEDGAAVYLPGNDSVLLPFGKLAPELLSALEASAIPLTRGAAIAATTVPHDRVIHEVLRRTGGGATVEYNRGAVMVLPPGATKGTGLRIALELLGYSAHNVVACGDAENDRSLFELAELGLAVDNATPEMKRLADAVLPKPDGAGVRSLVDELIAGRIIAHRERPERQLRLGTDRGGGAVTLSPFVALGANLGIVGSSASGKSYIAGSIAEELLEKGYQVCVVDPEGDYRGLRAFPHTLSLGGPEAPLPQVIDILTLLEYTNVSLILDLTGRTPAERSGYLEALLQGLLGLRARRGRPHWLLIDEVQGFCGEDGPLTDLVLKAMAVGGVGVVSYSPSRVAATLLAAVDLWLLTGLKDSAEAEALAPYLTPLPAEEGAATRIAALLGEACLYPSRTSAHDLPFGGPVEFRTVRRVVAHVRHLHKYLRAPLPAAKRFYFRGANGAPGSAASLWEFREALAVLPPETLHYHLDRGDFERWLGGVLNDRELARRMRKLAHRPLRGEGLRDALLTTVATRYEELERLI